MQTQKQLETVMVCLKGNQQRQGQAVALWGDFVLVMLEGEEPTPRPYDPALIRSVDGQPWYAAPTRGMQHAWGRPS
ncbi:hypothetical protein [Magnetococcus marinus]|uniref:hypothetical protein n=1 Tax=Magnetococcus marinus TaxID=1124597 RepID=UPI000038179D|nr:hypothetical protein [Magnetococcus marinus]